MSSCLLVISAEEGADGCNNSFMVSVASSLEEKVVLILLDMVSQIILQFHPLKPIYLFLVPVVGEPLIV